MITLKTKALLTRLGITAFLLLMLASAGFSQQRIMEKLNRGLVAVEADNGIFLSWRKFATEPDSVTFNVYRNNVLVNASPIEDVSNYFDGAGTTESYYHVEVLLNGAVTETSEPALVWKGGFKEIPLQTPAGYSPNDASVADLDGDGEFEIVVKMMRTTKDNSQSGVTDPVFLHAYEMNGTLMWSIDLGINIRAGAHYNPFMVYDLNGDGVAEMAVKTAPGTKDGLGNFLSDGPAANDDDAADYRNSNGYVLSGPEYLTLFEGKTGAEISTVDYVPQRGNVGDWGDTYGNRVDRFLACVAYFDSLPSLVMQRGYYTRVSMAAWDYVNGELVQRWIFDTDSAFTGQDGNPYNLYEGQGSSSLTMGDVDNDGFDEIIYGSAAVDHDGTGLYTVGNNHGDASHLGDFLPNRPGLEYYMPSETAYGTNAVTGGRIPAIYVIDAADGTVLWEVQASGPADVGRAVVGNVLASSPGCEFWASNGIGMVDEDGDPISYTSEGPSINFVTWWDGDLQRELLNSNAIKKWTDTTKFSLIEPEECESNNGTKATPALSGDIIGDWREEVIWRTSDNQSLRIYSTPDTTPHGFYTLLHDPQYRLALTWQNGAYNQPPHPSFFIGDSMAPLPTPAITMTQPAIGPYLEITNPSYGYELGLGNSVYVTIKAVGFSDTTTIYLNNGSTLMTSINSMPYVIKLDTLTSGNYDLKAWAYDSSSNVVESAIVPITVDQGLPHLTLLTPLDGAIYNANDSILLSAEAYDTNGHIDSINVYFNGVSVATLVDSPYSQMLANPGYGVYSVYAIATDNDGATDTSDTRIITIGQSTIIQENELGYCDFIIAGTVDSNNAGFTGTGFANTQNVNGSGINWAVDIQADGDYIFYWRYASGNDRAAELTLNGAVSGGSLDFLNTDGSWTTWYIQTSNPVNLTKGYYDVQLTATTSNGLGNIDYLGVLAFSSTAAEGLHCDSIAMSIDDAWGTTDDISIYPVPASDFLNIQLLAPNARMESVVIYDISGKTLLAKASSDRETQLDIRRLSPGIYLARVKSSTGKMYIKRFIIK